MIKLLERYHKKEFKTRERTNRLSCYYIIIRSIRREAPVKEQIATLDR